MLAMEVDERLPPHTCGNGKIFTGHVSQANYGCDFDFLETVTVKDIAPNKLVNFEHRRQNRNTRRSEDDGKWFDRYSTTKPFPFTKNSKQI